MKDAAKLAAVRSKLEKARVLCVQAATLMRAADPTAPGDHVAYSDDFAPVVRGVDRAIDFVKRRAST